MGTESTEIYTLVLSEAELFAICHGMELLRLHPDLMLSEEAYHVQAKINVLVFSHLGPPQKEK